MIPLEMLMTSNVLTVAGCAPKVAAAVANAIVHAHWNDVPSPHGWAEMAQEAADLARKVEDDPYLPGEADILDSGRRGTVWFAVGPNRAVLRCFSCDLHEDGADEDSMRVRFKDHLVMHARA